MNKLILVVEDTEDNRQILRDLLTHAGFDLIEAGDGVAGLAMARAHRPDLVLMDLQLPLLDGFETARRIKADPNLHETPIIAVTSYAMPGDAERAFASGCDAHIAKPFSPRLLLARVKELLGRAQDQPSPPKYPFTRRENTGE
jgi:two-component system cell cycle response regulator DivK